MKRLVHAVLGRVVPVVIAARAIYRMVMRPLSIGVRVLIIQDNQVLLVRRHGSSRWDLPGGGVKRGETLRAAAAREAFEETGSRVEPDYLLGMYFNQQEHMSDHIAVYVCRCPTPPAVPLNLEIATAQFWPWDALPERTSGAVQRRLSEYRSGMRGLDERW